MKKMILSLLLALFAVASYAQQTNNGGQNSQWLTEFNTIDLNGPFSVVFEQIPSTEAPRLTYDTKGSYTSKFLVEVKGNVLRISEKFESNRKTVTEVKVSCHNIDNLRVSGATVSFAVPVKGTMLDVVVVGGATLTMPAELTDLYMDISGKSRVTLLGDVRYLKLVVSTAKVDAMQLEVMAANVEASNKGEVMLNVTERVEAKASTGGRVTYLGDPTIVRKNVTFTGGEIFKAQQ